MSQSVRKARMLTGSLVSILAGFTLQMFFIIQALLGIFIAITFLAFSIPFFVLCSRFVYQNLISGIFQTGPRGGVFFGFGLVVVGLLLFDFDMNVVSLVSLVISLFLGGIFAILSDISISMDTENQNISQ